MKTRKITGMDGQTLTTLMPENAEDLRILDVMEAKGQLELSSFAEKRARAKAREKGRRKASEWLDETCKFAHESLD